MNTLSDHEGRVTVIATSSTLGDIATVCYVKTSKHSSSKRERYRYLLIALLSLNSSRHVGRESSHRRKELFNLPPLVLKAKAPRWLCLLLVISIGVPVQALGWLSPRFGIGCRR